MASNLDHMLEDKFHRANLADVTDRSDAPLEDAVAMLVREKITGRKPPKSAQAVVDVWRDWIEERAGENLENLDSQLDDQEAFAKATRDLIADLEMADELGEDPQTDDQDQESEEEQQSETQEDLERENEEATGSEEAAPDESETTG